MLFVYGVLPARRHLQRRRFLFIIISVNRNVMYPYSNERNNWCLYNVTSNSMHFLLSQHPSSSTRLHPFKVITFLNWSTPAKELPVSNFLPTFYRLNIDLTLSLLSRINFPVPPRRTRSTSHFLFRFQPQI